MIQIVIYDFENLKGKYEKRTLEKRIYTDLRTALLTLVQPTDEDDRLKLFASHL